MNYTITITRQFGSLGRPIAKKLAEILEIEYYDRDIVEETSKNLGIPVSVISNQEEIKNSFFNMIYPLGTETLEQQDLIFEEQAKIIRGFAERKSCIIVGRCSDYILRNNKNCMNVYIYAPYEARRRNCIDYLRMDNEMASRMIQKVDKARDKYHKNYAGYLPNDYEHKEVMVDSSVFGIEGTAKVLAATARERFQI